MASQPARKRATYADIEALPEHLVGEIIDGELYVHPRPAPRHAEAGSQLLVDLKGAFQRGRGGPGGWWILPEPEIHLEAGEVVVVPDLAGWRKEALPALPEGAYFTLAPAWVCEVLSASTEVVDRGKKMTIHARHGVRDAWLVDPGLRRLEAFVNDQGVWRPAGTWRGAERVRASPFAEYELDLALLWG